MSQSAVLTALGTLVVLALIIGPWLVATANRLMRLHVRTDAAWAAADAALARRAVVARAVAAAGCLPPERAEALRLAAERDETMPREEREVAENELTELLAELDREVLPDALATELSDAEQRVVIARRVHNDAVRDTLSQRRRRVVRWFKLAGTAPRPAYLEIAEPELAEADFAEPRTSARVVLVDSEHRVLLFHGADPADSDRPFWFTVGGGVHARERLRAAALRELREETGIELVEDRLVGPVWRRRVVFRLDGHRYDGDEWFFLAELPDGHDAGIDTSSFTDLEHSTIDGYRWWSAAELRATEDTVYPAQLAELLPDLLDGGWDGQLRTIK